MELHCARRRSSLDEPEGFACAAQPGRSQVVSLAGAGARDRARAGVERALRAPNHDPVARGETCWVPEIGLPPRERE